MFANRWYVPLMPLVLFWSGAWLRRVHPRPVWVLAGLMLAWSMAVSMLGATNPMPREGYNDYTAGDALVKLFRTQRQHRDAVVEK